MKYLSTAHFERNLKKAAKIPFSLTNKGFHVQSAMARVVQQRDALFQVPSGS
jgi:hypothetical protein